MEMDTFRGVLILHFLSMITPQYHHIFFILWNSLSFSSVRVARSVKDVTDGATRRLRKVPFLTKF